MPTREQQNLAAYLWHNQGRRGRKMQWLDFSSKGDAERALQAIRGNICMETVWIEVVGPRPNICVLIKVKIYLTKS